MNSFFRRARLVLVVAIVSGCARGSSGGAHEPLLAEETFHWIRQPIAFAPPPARWYRDGDNGDGKLGVRFILRDGGGQCISIAGYRKFAERDRSADLKRLAGRIDSLSQHEFLHEVSLARARTDDPLSEGDANAALAVNAALDRATSHYLEDSRGFVAADLEEAVRAATSYQPTLAELLPKMRLHPEARQDPAYWRLGHERDTTWAGQAAFASDDTLVLPEQTLLYHQVFWVVNGCAFEAIFQGKEENLETFHRVVDSIRFPEP